MNFTRSVENELTYDDAVTAVKTALAEQGFGVLTEIDVRQTIKDKLTSKPPRNSSSAPATPNSPIRRSASATLLPCNVVVRRTADRTVVEALDKYQCR